MESKLAKTFVQILRNSKDKNILKILGNPIFGPSAKANFPKKLLSCA